MRRPIRVRRNTTAPPALRLTDADGRDDTDDRDHTDNADDTDDNDVLKLNQVAEHDKLDFIALVEALTGQPCDPDANYYDTIPAFRHRVDNTWVLEKPSVMYHKIAMGNVAKIIADSRVVWLADLTDLGNWIKRSCENNDTERWVRHRFNHNNTYITRAKIEGIHFNKHRADAAQKLLSNRRGCWYFIDRKRKIYLTEDNSGFNGLLGFPVEEADFIAYWQELFVRESARKLRLANDSLQAAQATLHQIEQRIGRLRLINQAITKFSDQTIKDVLRQIRGIDVLQDITFIDNSIVADSKDLWFTHADKRWYLGQARIWLTPDAGIKVQNLRVRKGNPYAFPHVDGSHACLGGYNTVLSNCYLSLDYYTLMLSTLEYLRTVNPEDSIAMQRLAAKFSHTRLPDSKVERSRIIVLWEEKSDADAAEVSTTTTHDALEEEEEDEEYEAADDATIFDIVRAGRAATTRELEERALRPTRATRYLDDE